MSKKINWIISNPIPNSSSSCNKDLNGGYGTWDKFSDNPFSRIISKAKKKNIKLPVLCLGYIHSILKNKNIDCSYSESYKESISLIKKKDARGIIIYGSIVCCDLENKLINEIKLFNTNIKVIVIGTFPTKFPNLFKNADHIIIGEPENFFINWSGKLDDLEKMGKEIFSENITNLDTLPLPKFNINFAKKYSYRPMLPQPTGFIEATRGCPYSCGYYCTYGENQGKAIRSHTPSRLVEIMQKLKVEYGFKSFQFRDPVFGLKKEFIENFCLEILRSGLDTKWGMETRIDLLSKSSLRLMKKAGLTSINIGIETPNKEIAASNKRKLCPQDKQKDLIDFAFKNNIKINAFYILGLEQDNEESCNETINYSLGLNTYMARYSVCTPYPGTGYYDDLKKDNRVINNNLSSFNQQELVYKHNNLSEKIVKKLIQKAYIKYYFRPKVISNIIKQKFER